MRSEDLSGSAVFHVEQPRRAQGFGTRHEIASGRRHRGLRRVPRGTRAVPWRGREPPRGLVGSAVFHVEHAPSLGEVASCLGGSRAPLLTAGALGPERIGTSSGLTVVSAVRGRAVWPGLTLQIPDCLRPPAGLYARPLRRPATDLLMRPRRRGNATPTGACSTWNAHGSRLRKADRRAENTRLDRDPAARKYVPVADGPPRDGADRAAVT